MKTEWLDIPDERNPEYPDPIPNESTVIAQAIVATAQCAVCGGPPADHGLLNGYPDKHAFETGLPPLTEQERQDLADEIEFDLL